MCKIANSQFDKFSISGGVVDGISQIPELLKYNSDTVYFSPPITSIKREIAKKNKSVKDKRYTIYLLLNKQDSCYIHLNFVNKKKSCFK